MKDTQQKSDIKCTFSVVSERDMDMLFLYAFAKDKGFLQLFLSKTEWSSQSMTVIDVELSKKDSDLGESDITVTLECDGVRYALLIEDKIDAVAMPKQHQRYIERAEKAVSSNDYADYRIFIVCPQKYHETDEEAKKYENYVSYEECAAYFSKQSDLTSIIYYQQLNQAIEKAKKPPQINFNDCANIFLNRYYEYQKKYYPNLTIRTKTTSNGWWIRFGTRLSGVILYHKTNFGAVDLQFAGAAQHIGLLERALNWYYTRSHGHAHALVTGESATLRIDVPALKTDEVGFEKVPDGVLRQFFDAVTELAELANFLSDMLLMTTRPDKEKKTEDNEKI